MRRLLLVHPTTSTNFGDHVILEGVKKLLGGISGADFEFDFCNVEEIEKDPSCVQKYASDGYHAMIVTGTPWLWDMCNRSNKVQGLKHLLENISCKKIALGIGSCYPLTTNTLGQFLFQVDGKGRPDPTRQDSLREIKEIYSMFDLIVVRDQIALRVFEEIGIKAHETICPAAFSVDAAENIEAGETRPLLVFTNPSEGISNESCDSVYTSDFIQFQKWFKETYDPRVVTMCPLDRDWCVGQGWEVEWIQDIKRFEEILMQTSFCISSRVHAAIPATVFGIDTYILPLDTRYLTAVKVGAQPILPTGDLSWWMYDFTPKTNYWQGTMERKLVESYRFLTDLFEKELV